MFVENTNQKTQSTVGATRKYIGKLSVIFKLDFMKKNTKLY